MFRLSAALLLVAAGAAGHETITTNLTFSKEISRILYKRCVACHKEYASYDSARPWAKAIRDEVLSRRMPPWGAVKGVGDFRDDASLSQVEIDMITAWVEGGAPEGDPQYLPSAPHMHPVETPRGRELKLPATLSASISALALRPAGNCEVTAFLPDGSVRPLIWVRWFDARWPRTYAFRDPLNLPRGTRIVVTGTPGVVLITSTARQPRSPSPGR